MSRLKIAIPVLPGARIANYLNALSGLGAEGAAVDGRDAAGFAGLLLPGGGDVDPALYGQRNTACEGVNRALDDLQLRAVAVFLAAGKPVLGICRGHQLMNVYFGGTLFQHLPTARVHDWDEGSTDDKAHLTTAEKGSFLEALYGGRFPVNSAHHQGVDVLGKGLRIVQRADDGVAEAFVHETLPVWSVQWHPERMCFAHARPDTVDGAAVIQMFLNECQRRL